VWPAPLQAPAPPSADSSGVQDTLAEAWDGTSWSIQTTPGPSGGQLPELSGVACTTANGCTAVGDYYTITGVFLTLVEVGPSPRASGRRGRPNPDPAGLRLAPPTP
jgi:hypothetical protein